MMVQRIPLKQDNAEDVAFCREVFGFDAQRIGFLRERDRLYYFEGAVGQARLDRAAYDLPAQVVSDRILFRRARRRLLQQQQSDELIGKLRDLFAHGDESVEREWVNAYTKRGFFYGPGRFTDGGWQLMPTL